MVLEATPEKTNRAEGSGGNAWASRLERGIQLTLRSSALCPIPTGFGLFYFVGILSSAGADKGTESLEHR
jgi:hypothetical protein